MLSATSRSTPSTSMRMRPASAAPAEPHGTVTSSGATTAARTAANRAPPSQPSRAPPVIESRTGTRSGSSRSARRARRSAARARPCARRARPERERRATGAVVLVPHERRRQRAFEFRGQSRRCSLDRAGRFAVGEQVEQCGGRGVVVLERRREACPRAGELRPGFVEPVIAEPVDAGRQFARALVRRRSSSSAGGRSTHQQVEAGESRCRRRSSSSRKAAGLAIVAQEARHELAARRRAFGRGASTLRKLVTTPKRPQRDTPIHVPPARRSRPASIPGTSVHQPSGAAGRSWNSSRLPATTSR